METQVLYDGFNSVQELDATASPTANLVNGLGIDDTLTRTDGTGSYALLADALGSTLALVDSSATMATQYIYGPFGQTQSSGVSSLNATQFTGRENDATGLYFFRGRYYGSAFQRFISDDPLGLLAGLNATTYVGGYPLRYVDPLGLKAQNPNDGGGGQGVGGGGNQQDDRILQLAKGISAKAGSLDDPNFYVDFYARSFVGGALNTMGPEALQALKEVSLLIRNPASGVITGELPSNLLGFLQAAQTPGYTAPTNPGAFLGNVWNGITWLVR